MLNDYDAIAARFAGGGDSFRQRPYVDRLISLLPVGGAILDVGCGTGRPIARYLADRGFVATGIDLSAKMLEFARRNVPEGAFLQGDMRTIQVPQVFDATIAWDSLFHLPRHEHPFMYERFSQWLKPGGLLLLTSGGSGDEGFVSEMFGNPFFYSSFDPEVVQRLLEEAGFAVIFREVDDPSSRGHLVVLARSET